MPKRILLYLTLLLICIYGKVDAQSTIKWTNGVKLKWADFKGTPNEDVLAYAQTSYKIEIIPGNVKVDAHDNVVNYQSLTTEANFYCDYSWVYEENDYLLLHEQLHFDIAGLYAYKMRVEFEKLKKKKDAQFNSYLKVYEKLWAECRAIQELYDKETNHGQLIEENNRWIKEINTQIIGMPQN